ncbi:High-affinity branched-chain amino acid transport ATP-binding protein LivF [wastewater metagenome]|uniref:High-affinity branched-chain amino acid transport ATP-binding protein LivF n=2 Tax=unclassified sequences TaxID=12908 RepID=A0A5B8RFN4_9ZZZZ|nr:MULTISPECIES: ABC transporter ATP-binding protein [Arhodomonas]QEA07396.1 high-affinity branched-chain amino acid transport ATP-binding protein LivF [uncultured organism]
MVAKATDVRLEVDGLQVHRGTSHVLQSISLGVGGEPVAIVGRNGMGKTTLCQAIMGLVPATGGGIRFAGRSIDGRKPHAVARSGLGYVPQGRRIFPSLTVDEHLRLVSRRGRVRWSVDGVYELFPRLAERRDHGGSALSGGEQQMLAIARALLTNPRLVIMDEPTEGLAPAIVEQLVGVLRQLAREGTGLLLIEQNFGVATAVAERVMVMLNGQIVHEAPASEIREDDEVKARYLGVG